MSTPEPRAFASEWIRAWNARDVEAVLANYADDVVFTSPTALRVPKSGGTIRGRTAVRQYWRTALEGNPTSTSNSSRSTPASTRSRCTTATSWAG